MLVDQVEQRVARRRRPPSRRRCARPCRARSRTAGAARRPDRARCPTVFDSGRPSHRGGRCARVRPRPMNRARSVSYCGAPTVVALDDGEMRGPDLAARRASAAGGWRSARRIRADTRSATNSLGEGRMRRVGRRRGQHQLGVGGHLDLARRAGRCWSATRGAPRRRPRPRPARRASWSASPSRRMNSARSSANTHLGVVGARPPPAAAPADQTAPLAVSRR